MSKKFKGEDNSELKGTLISVFSIGLLILVMWFSVYFFYITR
ncbi:cytochrome C oxidase subunit II [Metabacillus litoralis]|nr:cytochrome C oxidase subunit II [Metabacillus litoralis]